MSAQVTSATSFDTMDSMVDDELAQHLNSLEREAHFRVAEVLKESPFETTEKVFLPTDTGEQGPFIRKYIAHEAGLGDAYRRIYDAQRAGKQFVYVPRVYECYDKDDALVVVMEYIQGETLADVVSRCDPSPQLAADVFPWLCNAVIELHEGFDTPLIHRDLKPSNIILSQDRLSIIDFGIARSYKEEAKTDTMQFGTRAYAPPEQFGYKQTDERSDVYALGMLLYFCLVEKTPDDKVWTEGFFVEEIPSPMRTIILRATEFDPGNRYGSVRELKGAFLDAMRVLGIHSQTEGKPSVTPRKKPKKPMPQWLGTTWNVVLLLFFIGMLITGYKQTFISPNGAFSEGPFWYHVLAYIGIMVGIAGLLVGVSDKRLLVETISVLMRIQGWKGVLFGVAFAAACFMLLIVVGVIERIAIQGL